MVHSTRTQRKSERDPYEVLQVRRDASTEVIRAAYRVLARTYHPDVNDSPAAGRHMQELSAAYNALIDPDRRAEYDAQELLRRTRAAAARRLRPPPHRLQPELPPVVLVQPFHSRTRLIGLAMTLIVGGVVLAVLLVGLAIMLDVLDAPTTTSSIQPVLSMRVQAG
jgi:hypothetical protein